MGNVTSTASAERAMPTYIMGLTFLSCTFLEPVHRRRMKGTLMVREVWLLPSAGQARELYFGERERFEVREFTMS